VEKPIQHRYFAVHLSCPMELVCRTVRATGARNWHWHGRKSPTRSLRQRRADEGPLTGSLCCCWHLPTVSQRIPPDASYPVMASYTPSASGSPYRGWAATYVQVL